MTVHTIQPLIMVIVPQSDNYAVPGWGRRVSRLLRARRRRRVCCFVFLFHPRECCLLWQAEGDRRRDEGSGRRRQTTWRVKLTAAGVCVCMTKGGGCDWLPRGTRAGAHAFIVIRTFQHRDTSDYVRAFNWYLKITLNSWYQIGVRIKHFFTSIQQTQSFLHCI